MTWVIVVQEERADYGEGGMVVNDELSAVIGPFFTEAAAKEFDIRVYPPGPYRTTDVMEVTAP